MSSGPSELRTFSFFNLVSISTQSKLIFSTLDKVSFVGSVSNGALFSTTYTLEK